MLEPYKYHKTDDLVYYFETKYDVKYKVNIFLFDQMFYQYEEVSKFIYSFDLSIVGVPNRVPLDPQIGITVAFILKDFFKNEENAIIYVCESLDNRQKARKRKFDEWFQKYKGTDIIQLNMTAFIEGTEILNSLIMHKNNPNFKEILFAFSDLNNNMEEK